MAVIMDAVGSTGASSRRDDGIPIHGSGGVTVFDRPPTIDDLPMLQSSPFPFDPKSPAYAHCYARLALNPQGDIAAKIVEGYVFGRTSDKSAVYFSTTANDRRDFVFAESGTCIPLTDIAVLTVTKTCWQPAPPEYQHHIGVTVSNC